MSQNVLTVTLNAAIDWTVQVPGFALGEVNRAASETTGAGGKGINVAAVLADYGLSVAASGFLGRDNEEPFRQLFARRHIEDWMVRLDGSTRLGIKVVDSSGNGGTTDINFPGLQPSKSDLRVLSETIAQTHAKWIVFAGSVPPGVDVGIYRDLIAQARLWGCRIALDASGEALGHSLDAPADELPHLVKPNLVELEDWAGTKLSSKQDILAAARDLVERGIERVAVSMGSDGLLLVSREEAVLATPPSIEVGSTVGAGDALVAGLVAAAIKGLDLAESARLGTSFSLDVLTHAGAYGLSKNPLSAWYPQISIQTLVAKTARRSSSVPVAWSPESRNLAKNVSLAKPV